MVDIDHTDIARINQVSTVQRCCCAGTASLEGRSTSDALAHTTMATRRTGPSRHVMA